MSAAETPLPRVRVEPGTLLVLLAAVCWGTTGTAQAFAPAGASSLSIGAARLIVGGLALVAYAAGNGSLRRWRALPPGATLLAAVSMAAYQLTFFAGVRRTGVAVGTVVAIGSVPIFAGLFAFLVLRERPRRRWAVATLLAVAGAALLVLAQGHLRAEPLGMILAAAAGATCAVYTLTSARLVRRVPADLAAAAAFGLGALLLLPVLLSTDLRWLTGARGLFVALHLGLVATALAYVLFTRALLTVPPSTAVTLGLGEPVVASLLGVLLLGERLPPPAWAGVALVFAGLAYLSIAPRAQ